MSDQPIRFRTRSSGVTPPPTGVGEFRMENKGKGRPSGLPAPMHSQRAGVVSWDEFCLDQLHAGPPFRTGGPFFHTLKFYADNSPQGSTYVVGPRITDPQTLGFIPTPEESWHYTYKGGFCDPFLGSPPPLSALSFTPTASSGVNGPSHPDVNPDDLTNLGNRAWGKLRPDPAHAGLGQAIAEAKDLPNMLLGTARSFHLAWQGYLDKKKFRRAPKQATDEFINQNFGWAPFLGDVGDMYKLVTDFRALEKKEIERNGKWRKRRRREEDVRSETLVWQANSQSNGSYAFPPLYSPNVNLNLKAQPGMHGKERPDHLSVHRVSVMEIWYEGKFRTYRPEFDAGLSSGYPGLDSANRAMTMAGLRITPTLLYNITPWTWLVDWFAGVGDAVQRYEDMLSDTVAAEYFYLMRRLVSRYEYTITKQTRDGALTLKWMGGVETKRRAVGGNAFGFSGSPSGLSGRQLAILGALGGSRVF